MTVAAFVAGMTGVALSALSLGWQIASWLLSAGRVRATLRYGVLGMGGVVLRDADGGSAPVTVDDLQRQGANGPDVLAVKVSNIGRAPVTVASYSVRHVASGMSFVPIGEAMGPALPHRMEPGESKTWLAQMDTVRALVHASQVIRGGSLVNMTVELGTGKIVTTRGRLEVRAGPTT